MLAEDYPGLVVEDDDCGCTVVTVEIDGRRVDAHHWIPDDFAPHVPDSECGCKPVLRADPERTVEMLYEHFDQDTADYFERVG
jgi:hypothetical protein